MRTHARVAGRTTSTDYASTKARCDVPSADASTRSTEPAACAGPFCFWTPRKDHDHGYEEDHDHQEGDDREADTGKEGDREKGPPAPSPARPG